METKDNLAYRKARRVAIGTLEGLAHAFIIPTSSRWDREYKISKNDYQRSGHFVGIFANISAHLGAYLLLDDWRVLVPLLTTNTISWGCEKVRKYLKRKEYYKEEKKDE